MANLDNITASNRPILYSVRNGSNDLIVDGQKGFDSLSSTPQVKKYNGDDPNKFDNNFGHVTKKLLESHSIKKAKIFSF